MRNEISSSAPRADASARRAERLKRFSPLFRDRVAALTCCSPQAEDLIDSFPGLLVALVSDVGTRLQRARAFEAILNGDSVKYAAECLELPIWLRKMPPEAFREPLRRLPNEQQFTAKIANFIPAKAHRTGDWLEHVSFAEEACDSDFALWVAKHCTSISPSRRKMVFMYMASWAWHSHHQGTTGYHLIVKPWSPKMGLRRATEELMRWRRRADLACLIGGGIECAWLQGSNCAGYDFVPLLTLDDFITESQAMSNCLDQYADRLATGLIRVFSIRRNGKPVADIEVGPMPARAVAPSIVQIKAAKNRQAPIAIWNAAHAWLASQPLEALSRRPGYVRSAGRTDRIEPFWRPFLGGLTEARQAEFESVILTSQRRSTRHHLRHPPVTARGALDQFPADRPMGHLPSAR